MSNKEESSMKTSPREDDNSPRKMKAVQETAFSLCAMLHCKHTVDILQQWQNSGKNGRYTCMIKQLIHEEWMNREACDKVETRLTAGLSEVWIGI